jgi:hypothetical protein
VKKQICRNCRRELPLSAYQSRPGAVNTPPLSTCAECVGETRRTVQRVMLGVIPEPEVTMGEYRANLRARFAAIRERAA